MPDDQSGFNQQILDGLGEFKFPATPPGGAGPTAPLFADTGTTVTGGGPRAAVDLHQTGIALVTGWRRGLVDDSHVVAGQGFRTGGECSLFARGTEWDLGPRNVIGPQGWSTVRRLRVRYEATAHDSWDTNETHLCGLQGEGDNAPHPAPWQLSLTTLGGDGNKRAMRFGIRLSDGREIVWDRVSYAIRTAPARSVFEARVDLDSGYAEFRVNDAVIGTCSFGGGPGLVLANNSTAPFAAGRLEVGFNSGGTYGDLIRDVTIHSIKVVANDAELCFFNGQGDTRIPTYPGGPSLPLYRAWTAGGGKYLWMVHKDQGVADANASVTVRDLTLTGSYGEPAIVLGATFGPMTLDRVTVNRSTRAIQTAGFPVVYPITIRDLTANSPFDSAVFLARAIGKLDTVLARYPRRASVDLLGFAGNVDRVFVAPSSEPNEAAVVQRGGDVQYNRVEADYEWDPGADYALVKVTPTSYDSAVFPTVADLRSCSAGGRRTLKVYPRGPFYHGEVRGTVDGTVVYALPQGD